MRFQFSDKTRTALWTAACFSFSLLVFAPGGLFLINQAAFSFGFTELLRHLVPMALGLMLVMSVLLLSSQGSFHKKTAVLMAGFSFLVWFQGKVMGWPYGSLDGRTIRWEDFRIQGVIDSALWIFMIGACILRTSFFYGLLRQIAKILIVTQIASVGVTAFQTHKERQDLLTLARVEQAPKFEFSKNKNVILLMLDEFQTDVFQEILEQDRSFEDIFDGFTYFRNTVAAYSVTELAVPALLTGRYYDPSETQRDYLREAFLRRSLPKTLKEQGFQVDLFPLPGTESIYLNEVIASNLVKPFKGKSGISGSDLRLLFNLTMLRSLPGPLKKFIPSGQWLLSRNQDTEKTAPVPSDGRPLEGLSSADRGRPFEPEDLNSSDIDIKFFANMNVRARFMTEKNVFKYFHLMGMHPPLRLNEQLRALPGIELNRKNYIRQAQAYLILCERFLEVLKRNGAYDDSLILIMGDHGCGRSEDLHVGAPDRRPGQSFRNLARGIPLMLIKPFGSRGKIKVSDAPVASTDVPRTVMSELKLQSDFPGISMFEQKEEAQRKRYFGFVTKVGTSNVISYITLCSVSGFSWLTESWNYEGLLPVKNAKGFLQDRGEG